MMIRLGLRDASKRRREQQPKLVAYFFDLDSTCSFVNPIGELVFFNRDTSNHVWIYEDPFTKYVPDEFW